MTLLSLACLLAFSFCKHGNAFRLPLKLRNSIALSRPELAVDLSAVAHRGPEFSSNRARGNAEGARHGPRESSPLVSRIDFIIRELQRAQSVADVHSTLADAAANGKLKVVHVNQAIGRVSAMGGASKDVDKLLTNLTERNLTPDVYTYATAIAACSNKRTQQADWRRAVALLHDMQAGGLTPDGVCYGAAAAACARGRSDAAAEAALALVERFKAGFHKAKASGTPMPENTKDHSNAGERGSLSRSVSHVYVSAMKACGQAGQWEASLRLLEELGELEERRSAFAWTAAVAACGAAGQWQRAVGLLDEMAAELSKVASVTSALGEPQGEPQGGREEKGDGQSGEQFLGDPTAAYNAAITACGRAGQWPAALAVFDRIRPEFTSDVESGVPVKIAPSSPTSAHAPSSSSPPPVPPSMAGAAARAVKGATFDTNTAVPSDAALAAVLVMLRLESPGLGHQKLTAALHTVQPFWAVNAQRVRRTMKLAHLAPGAPPPSNKALSQLVDAPQPTAPSPLEHKAPPEQLSARAHALREAATAYKYDSALELAEAEEAAAAADAEAARLAAFQAEIVVEVVAQTSAAEAAKKAKLEAEIAAKEARRAALACGASADLVSYNACLGALERGHQAGLAMQLFQELVSLSSTKKNKPSKGSSKSGIASLPRHRINLPDRVSVNAVLSALARVGDWAQAMEVAETHLDGMASIMATVRAENFAYVDQIGTGKLLFSTVESAASGPGGAPVSTPWPSSPDRATFTLLAKACCMGGEPWLGLEMKAALHQRLGLEADPTLLRTLICACEDGQRQANTVPKANPNDGATAPMAGKSLVQAALMLREELQQLAPREVVRRSHRERRAAAAARSRLGSASAPGSGMDFSSSSASSSSSSPSSESEIVARATAAGATVNDRKLRELGFTSGESPGVVAHWSFTRQAIDDVVLEAKARKEQAPPGNQRADSVSRANMEGATHSECKEEETFDGAGVGNDDNGDAALEIELEGVLDDLGRAVGNFSLYFTSNMISNYFTLRIREPFQRF